MIGGPLFYDFARVGANTRAFQSFVLSAGVVTDYVYGAGMHWQGGCGGFPCDGSGSLNEWNVVGELKAATPLGGGNTLTGYISAGDAIFWPSGHPTGGTTSFLGSATILRSLTRPDFPVCSERLQPPPAARARAAICGHRKGWRSHCRLVDVAAPMSLGGPMLSDLSGVYRRSRSPSV
jgi:hypothetical protein